MRIKELSAEAKFIRLEEKRSKDWKEKFRLSHHRKTQVRPAARHANLAYAFFRGTPYKQVESSCHEKPDPHEIARIVAKNANVEQSCSNHERRKITAKVKAWLNMK